MRALHLHEQLRKIHANMLESLKLVVPVVLFKKKRFIHLKRIHLRSCSFNIDCIDINSTNSTIYKAQYMHNNTLLNKLILILD